MGKDVVVEWDQKPVPMIFVDVFSRGVSGGSGYLYHTRKEITTYYW